MYDCRNCSSSALQRLVVHENQWAQIETGKYELKLHPKLTMYKPQDTTNYFPLMKQGTQVSEPEAQTHEKIVGFQFGTLEVIKECPKIEYGIIATN